VLITERVAQIDCAEKGFCCVASRSCGYQIWSTLLSQLFRRYQCAQEHPCFYALTTLFPSISRYKRSHTRADKQDGIRTTTLFSPTHFHSIKQPIPRVLSAFIMMALTRIYAPSLLLCLFMSPVTYRGQGDTGHNQRQVMKVRTCTLEKAKIDI